MSKEEEITVFRRITPGGNGADFRWPLLSPVYKTSVIITKKYWLNYTGKSILKLLRLFYFFIFSSLHLIKKIMFRVYIFYLRENGGCQKDTPSYYTNNASYSFKDRKLF